LWQKLTDYPTCSNNLHLVINKADIKTEFNYLHISEYFVTGNI
jgi:hypothetical protein